MTTVQTAPPAAPQRVTVTDIDMPFGSMVVFMLKWALAAIPAGLILLFVIFMASAAFSGVGLALLGLSNAAGESSLSSSSSPSTSSDSRAAYDRDLGEWEMDCRSTTSQDCALRKTMLDMRLRALSR